MAFSPTSTDPHRSSSLDADRIEGKHIWRNRISRWLGRDEQPPGPEIKYQEADALPKPSLGRRLSRKVVPGLPRPGTFRRQNSERRERLKPVEQALGDRRTTSVDRRAMHARPHSPPPLYPAKLSAPAVCNSENDSYTQFPTDTNHNDNIQIQNQNQNQNPVQMPRPAPPPSPPPDDLPNGTADFQTMSETAFDDQIDEQIRAELEEKWILNLSMHFRDKSPREKFFVTYAEEPTHWRRVTISCDYRDALPNSLERVLQTLQYQRDKSARIYEAIRLSLPDIQFYNTVTNLKLETSQDDRLHVHVTEDTNEIIPYPSTDAVRHLNYEAIPESEVQFDSHMSGFVYKVRVNNQICIKKEIPGPDSVEEFLYEINALHALIGSPNVVQFRGLVIDEKRNLVKGLLISYAAKGPLVDILFDHKNTLEWSRRQRWAKQIVRGLASIHESGYVQGDFTLSNIVIDDADAAQIIDINRRGCPVGWEPPEIAQLIESSQRISMYIGVKSDLFQLGMVLWALAEQEDEPERQPRPLSLEKSTKDIPSWYRDITARCLSPHQRDRLSAKDLLALFPQIENDNPSPPKHSPLFPLSNLHSHPRAPPFHSSNHAPHPRSRSRSPSLDLPFDNSSSYLIHPPIPTPALSHPPPSQHPPLYDASATPNIISVSPRRERSWEDVDAEYRDFVQRFGDDDAGDERGRGRSTRRHGEGEGEAEGQGAYRGMAHVDSGLADMELAGVGGNEGVVAWDGRVVGFAHVEEEEEEPDGAKVERGGGGEVVGKDGLGKEEREKEGGHGMENLQNAGINIDSLHNPSREDGRPV